MDPLETHKQLFGAKAPATEKQLTFYASETARGFATKEHDTEAMDAVLVRALAQVRTEGSPDYHKVLVIFPEDQRDWVVRRIHNVAATTMTRLGDLMKKEKGQAVIAHVRRWLEALQLGPVSAWKGAGPPPRFVAFGYSKEDDVPSWLKEALV